MSIRIKTFSEFEDKLAMAEELPKLLASNKIKDSKRKQAEYNKYKVLVSELTEYAEQLDDNNSKPS